jgi:hypothetical protein
MKKLIFTCLMAAFTALATQVRADICVPGDLDFDATDCVANGGTIGTPIGIGGGPGGGGAVPIDGGLSVMLALGGALGARKVLKKKKENQD